MVQLIDDDGDDDGDAGGGDGYVRQMTERCCLRKICRSCIVIGCAGSRGRFSEMVTNCLSPVYDIIGAGFRRNT